MYLRLNKSGYVIERIPDVDPKLPGVSIEKRYPAEIISSLVQVDEGIEVEQGYCYNAETGAWEEPQEAEPEEADGEISGAELMAMLEEVL